MSECIVDVGNQRWVGHHFAPRGDIGNDYLRGFNFGLLGRAAATMEEAKATCKQEEEGKFFHGFKFLFVIQNEAKDLVNIKVLGYVDVPEILHSTLFRSE